MIRLENDWLRLTLEPEKCEFSLLDWYSPPGSIQHAHYGISLSLNLHKASLRLHDLVLVDLKQLQEQTVHGLLNYYRLIYQTQSGSFDVVSEFGLLQNTPLMLQKMRLFNRSNRSVFPDRLIFCEIPRGNLQLSDNPASATVCYVNGWQSWSPSGTYRFGERQQRSGLGLLTSPVLNNAGTPITRQKNHFSSDMFTVVGETNSQRGLLVGFLSQKLQFGSTETRLYPQPALSVWANGDKAELPDDQAMQTDWAAYSFISLNGPNAMAPFLEAVARENSVRVPGSLPVGWCSWYEFFSDVHEKDVRANLSKIVSMREAVPLQLLQIDDGYEKAVGDWFEFNSKFPRGLKPLAQEIRQAGLEPGLWLAPYILQRRSAVAKNHPDWLLLNENGSVVNAGFGWNSLTCSLDLTISEALDYTCQVVDRAVHEWSFPYLKLDFLYAAAIKGRYHDATQTRAQVLHKGLEKLREAAGAEATLLACGCPIGSALGLVDLMRVSEDVAPNWEPEVFGLSFPFKHEASLPSARNAIQNILARAEMNHTWWGNDPDCLLLRREDRLTLPEIQSLATVIGMTGGSLLLSDNLTHLPDERLRIAQVLLPILPGNPEVLDQFERRFPCRLKRRMSNPGGSYYLFAFFNWQNHESNLEINCSEWGLPAGRRWLAREFWNGQILQFGDRLGLPAVNAHGVRLLAVHALGSDPIYLGSDCHFSQGAELQTWKSEEDRLQIDLRLGHEIAGRCFIYSPCKVRAAWENQIPIHWEELADSVISLPIHLQPTSHIDVQFDQAQ